MNKLYTIVALPEKNTLDLLNSLRIRLYSEYLEDPRDPRSVVHITLAQLKTSNPKDERIANGLSEIGKKYLPIPLSDITIKTDTKIPDDSKTASNWIGLDIRNSELQNLSQEIQHRLELLEIDDTNNYLKRAGFHKQIPLHFTLCPSCIPEKTDEAVSIIHKTIPKEIIIDSLALRTEKGELLLQKHL